MDYFDAFEEIFAHIERYKLEHGITPTKLIISPSLYQWLCECRAEELLAQDADPTILDTPFGAILLTIDERLDPYQIITQ